VKIEVKGGDIVMIMLCIFAAPELRGMFLDYGFWVSSVVLVAMFLIIGLALLFIDLLSYLAAEFIKSK